MRERYLINYNVDNVSNFSNFSHSDPHSPILTPEYDRRFRSKLQTVFSFLIPYIYSLYMIVGQWQKFCYRFSRDSTQILLVLLVINASTNYSLIKETRKPSAPFYYESYGLGSIKNEFEKLTFSSFRTKAVKPFQDTFYSSPIFRKTFYNGKLT